MKAEVRLYFKGRIDWSTLYFDASCPTDVSYQAFKLAKLHKADHYSAGPAGDIAYPTKENQRISLAQFAGGMEAQIGGVKAAEGIDDYA